MKIIVVGAGIGGSALALSLEQAGLDYVLVEQAKEFTEVGAGIQLSPNGVRVLEYLGLKDDLTRFCAEPDSHKFSVWDTGETILSTRLRPNLREQYGHAYYHAHRADLIDALTSRLNRDRVLTDTRVTGAGQKNGRVWVDTAGGDRITGDVLIGADGIHSVIREQIFRPGAPRASGYVTWRGIVDTDDIQHLDIPVSAYVDMGPKLSFVYYYVSGGRKLNWLALGQTNNEKRESWSQTASKDEVAAGFDGWYDRPRALIDMTETTFVTALYDRDPLPNWVDGHIALMGDAAHAMLPYHAQGAVQSLEDAWVLARTLQLMADDPAAALTQFQSLRMDRANRIVQHSRAAEGWYHLEDPAEVARRNDRFRRHNDSYGDTVTPQQHWLYSYDAETAARGTDLEWQNLAPW